MNRDAIGILLVEDNPGDARLIRETLRESGLTFTLRHVVRLTEAREALASSPADVVLLDLSLPDAYGIETVRQTLNVAPDAAIVVLTGLDNEEIALEAVQAGAQDYLTKGKVDEVLLARSLRYAVERKRLAADRARLLIGERQARAEAEDAVRARDEVLRVVAHDIGNFLSAIRINASVLLRTLPEEQDNTEVRRRISEVRDSAAQMQRLSRDLLDVAALEAGRLSMELVPRAPDTLVSEAIRLFEPVATENGIRLTADLSDSLPQVLADPARILQVLGNLLGNAMKFTPEGGSVTVEAELVAEGICFAVADTGSGIPSDDLPHVFDRFWKRRTRNLEGTGLGLAICTGIVQAHGGRIWAESVPGVGSRFSFVLPAACEVEPTASPTVP